MMLQRPLLAPLGAVFAAGPLEQSQEQELSLLLAPSPSPALPLQLLLLWLLQVHRSLPLICTTPGP